MLYRKSGMPEDDEIVLCTITKIHFNSVFARLDEYDKSGMIHISEISPGRIRNIRDFVAEGKKVICKVLKVDPVKGHIDLSLRRVNEGQKRKKNADIKAEQKAEKIIEGIAKQIKTDFVKLYEEIAEKIFQNYEYIHEVFKEIAEEDYDISKLGIRKEIAEKLTSVIKEKIKPQKVEIKGKLKLTSYAPDGVEIVKKALAKSKAEIKYLGAGAYSIKVVSSDYKTAEKELKQNVEAVESFMQKNKGTASFERE